MAGKILSINLWYRMYKNKTDMQLKSFRKLGYDTYVATISESEGGLTLYVYELGGPVIHNAPDFGTDSDYHCADDNPHPARDISPDVAAKYNCDTIIEKKFNNYPAAFKYLFDYCADEGFSFVYIRRLMLKLLYAAPYFKKLSQHVPIVYEIPTYPLDKAWDIKLSVRNKLEFIVFNRIQKHITLIPTVLCDDVSVPGKWMPFLNSIDIDNYSICDVPELTDTIRLFISSNLAPSHNITRLFDAMKAYDGPYKLRLTIVSSDTPSYRQAREYAASLGISDIIDFLSEKPLSDVVALGGTHHIGVGILTYNEPNRTIDTSLKSKDYCAIGLPFFSSLKDLSFGNGFPYHYIVDNSNYDFNLEDIIEWYVNIRKDMQYKDKMYNYAKENLQYDNIALQILKCINQ